MKTSILYCALALLAGLAADQAQAAEPRGANKACAQDYQQLCKSVQPGGGRVIACLKQHEAELSAPCKTQISALAAGRRDTTTPP